MCRAALGLPADFDRPPHARSNREVERSRQNAHDSCQETVDGKAELRKRARAQLVPPEPIADHDDGCGAFSVVGLRGQAACEWHHTQGRPDVERDAGNGRRDRHLPTKHLASLLCCPPLFKGLLNAPKSFQPLNLNHISRKLFQILKNCFSSIKKCLALCWCSLKGVSFSNKEN